MSFRLCPMRPAKKACRLRPRPSRTICPSRGTSTRSLGRLWLAHRNTTSIARKTVLMDTLAGLMVCLSWMRISLLTSRPDHRTGSIPLWALGTIPAARPSSNKGCALPPRKMSLKASGCLSRRHMRTSGRRLLRKTVTRSSSGSRQSR